ncbi:MAG: TspO/MBR family protein [Candidatus Babeliales bacterium]
MNVKPNYIVIPTILIIISIFGQLFSQAGMRWYFTLKLPIFTPHAIVFSLVWKIIYVMLGAALLIIWNKFPRTGRFYSIIFTFIINSILNMAWTYFFFYKHMIGLSIFNALLLVLSTYVLILIIWPMSRLTASLLIPYALWLTFAVYLNIGVWLLN